MGVKSNEVSTLELDDEELVDDVLEDNEDELDEADFKADHEDSSVAGPVGSQTPTRKADKRNPEKSPHPQGSSKKVMSKAKLIDNVIKKMTGSNLDELNASYDRIMDILEGKENEEESTDLLSLEDIDVSEEIEKLFSNTGDIDEDFKDRAEVIFKTAVVNEVNRRIGSLNESTDEAISQSVENIEENLDSYLEYAINEWVEKNQVNIEKNIRGEIMEDFIQGMRNLFAEHYVDIPDEKVDVVATQSERIESLEEEVNEHFNELLELRNELRNYKRREAVLELSDDLSEEQTEKLFELSEGVEFSSDDELLEKIEMIKDNYFSGDLLNEEDGAFDLQELDDEEEINENVDPDVAQFAKAISRTVRR